MPTTPQATEEKAEGGNTRMPDLYVGTIEGPNGEPDDEAVIYCPDDLAIEITVEHHDAKALAANIVRAVNSHADLLEQTKLLERTLAYEIRKSEYEGDDEGARLKSFTPCHGARDDRQGDGSRLMIPCPICLDLGFYPIFDMDGEQRYSIDCPDCGGASVEERGESANAPKTSEPAS